MINKEKFLKKLEAGLAGLSPEERVAALQYYTEYLDEAGPEREAEVLAELGSPESVAADVRAASGEVDGWSPPTAQPEKIAEEPGHTPHAAVAPVTPQSGGTHLQGATADDIPLIDRADAGQKAPAEQVAASKNRAGENVPPQPYSLGGSAPQAPQPPHPYAPTATYAGNASYPPPPPGAAQSAPYPPRNGGQIALIVILCIFFSPVILGLLGAAGGLLVALVVLLLVPFIIAVTMVPSGIASFVMGILFLPASVGSGLVGMGVGLFVFALGLLAFYGGVKLFSKVLPAVFRGIAAFFRKIFHR